MNPLLKMVLFIFAGLAFLSAILLMPAAELMPAQVHEGPWTAGLSPVRSEAIMKRYGDIAQSVTDVFFKTSDLKQVVTAKLPDGSPGTVRAYELYAVFLGLAMICAAIALNSVGRTEAEDKTILPVKK